MSPQTFTDTFTQSLNFVWTNLVVLVPRVFLAAVLLIVFWVIAVSLETVIERFAGKIKADEFLKRIGMDFLAQKAGVRLNAGKFIGALIKWFFIIAGLLVASNTVGLNQVANFLTSILYYIPNLAVAAIIIVAGAMLADFAGKATSVSVSASGLKSGPFVSKVVRWAVLIFAFVAALDQLGVASTLINTFYIGIVAMFALAGGLAFGLGGKEHASEFIAKIKHDIGA